MAFQPPAIDETPATTEQPADEAVTPAKAARTKAPRTPIRQILRELDWTALLVVGSGIGATWAFLLAQPDQIVQILAGLLPVTGGIIVGRRVRRHINWHGFVLGGISALVAFICIGVLIAFIGVTEQLLTALLFAFGTLLPFPAFGVITASRSEQRARALREEQVRRGGRLDKPGRVRSLEDLRGLSLPQLGGYVADLFRKHDFLINDYRFDKDRLDFQVSNKGEPWLLRVTTAEKVKPGVAQELVQRMKAEGVKKGVVITSMDFQDGAARWAKDKPVVLLDGPTLLSMDD